MSEHEEQKLLFAWAHTYEHRYPELALLHAIPNAAKRSVRLAARIKSEGLKAGIPDTCLPIPRSIWHGAYCELKVGKNHPTPEQEQWLEALRRQGYAVCVAYGAQEAIRFYAEYLGLDIKEFSEWQR